ncbi:hypothetical protein DMUE_4762 [Dictyocoela muelleri]|nr:hypothetical protein DMUE_4762 [Dictyocoela muelleri]
MFEKRCPYIGEAGRIVIYRQSFISKRKYNRMGIKKVMWVFGCIESVTSKLIMKDIDNRSRTELERVIGETILRGGRVIQICGSFNIQYFETKNNTHIPVNPSKNFVNL